MHVLGGRVQHCNTDLSGTIRIGNNTMLTPLGTLKSPINDGPVSQFKP